jgi:hypothetical protein
MLKNLKSNIIKRNREKNKIEHKDDSINHYKIIWRCNKHNSKGILYTDNIDNLLSNTENRVNWMKEKKNYVMFLANLKNEKN